MPWIQRKLKRSYACNVDLLKQLREEKLWSQEKLADEAQLSERAISKAESGKPISPKSIDRIAMALSDDQVMIYPEDLITDVMKLAKTYVEAFHVHQGNMADQIRDFVDADAAFCIGGDPEIHPFAGVHRGIEQFDQAMKTFFRLFHVSTDPDLDNSYEFVAKANDVVVWGETWIHPVGKTATQPMPVDLRFRFRRGKLRGVESYYKVDFDSEVMPKPDNDPMSRSKRKQNLDDSHFDLEESGFDLPVR